MHVADVDQNALESLEQQVGADCGQQTTLLDIHLEGYFSVNRDEPRIADIDRLATILHRIFPRLRGRAPLPPPSPTADLWTRGPFQYSDVDRLLEMLYAFSISIPVRHTSHGCT